MRTERRRKTRVQFIPFMKWILGWYILAFGIIIAMIEPDFQDTWNKKSQRGHAD